MLSNINYLSVFVLFCFFNSRGQETLLIKGATGKGYIYKKISPDEARKEAIDEAKIDALRKAGVSENIQSHQVLLTSQNNLSLKQLFTSNVLSEIQGVVQSFSIVSEGMNCVDKNQVEYNVVLNALVQKYNSKVDPAFQITIEGLRGSYRSGEKMTFTFKGTQDGYLTIFNINESDTTLLFPLKLTDENKLSTGKIYTFPTNKNEEYVMETNKTTEDNQLLFVYTKNNYHFSNYRRNYKTRFEDVKSWLYSIEPNERVVSFLGFVIGG